MANKASHPGISVITVNYNNAAGLENTILSVINQTCTDYEFIIIDGGSTDKSVEVIKSYTEKIDFWTSEPDNGTYHAMNKGIAQAKGDYCLFLNSGDTFYKHDTLENAIAKFDNSDIIYGNALKVKPHHRRLIKYKKQLTPYDFYKTEPCLHHQASFIKLRLFEEFGMYTEEMKINADWEFFFRVIHLGKVSTKYINQTICVFDGTGLSNTLPQGSSKRVEANVVKSDILKQHFTPSELNEFKMMENKELKNSFFFKLKNKILYFSMKK